MKTKRKISLLIVVVLAFFNAEAQQMPQYSQYMLNDFVLNPAIAGTLDYYKVVSCNRYQWTGITDAPRTYVLSVNGPHSSMNMGFGGYIFNDVTGPVSRTGIYGAYAYNIAIQSDMNLSFGLFAGGLQYKMDATKIKMYDKQPDIAVDGKIEAKYFPDAALGIYLYAPTYFAGISANQLIGNKFDYYEEDSKGLNRLARHFYLYGGYKYSINELFLLEPSLFLKYVTPAKPQFDINAKIVYKNEVWAGVSYRYLDAVSILLGYNFQNQLLLGYAYDITVSSLNKYSKGTHEVLIGINFNKIKNTQQKQTP